ncbi:hypothetical protein WJX73_008590 [Symbiochloris irregularis]|uniref:FAD-binding PCMH-type domain-containing protein n=1 Tax=Symbiochloris irregularis TaxID=706552 RepID=A0AAW1NWQ2_9CHLO
MAEALGGQLTDVRNQAFDTTSTLKNHLRRGHSLLRAPVPRLYLSATSEADVVAGVKLALDQDLKLALHGSGHHFAATSLPQDGLTIDMSKLKDVYLDENTGIARFQAGLDSMELCKATGPKGWHFRVAHVTSVGIAGYNLGGGQGWGGMAVDQITAMDCVNVWEYPKQELKIVRVDADNHPELFWGLQGAGMMLGVVVAFWGQLQPIPKDGLIRATSAIWPLPLASKAWEAYNHYTGNHQHSPLVERSAAYVTIPGKGPALVFSASDWSTGDDEAARQTDAGSDADGDAKHIAWARDTVQKISHLSRGTFISNVEFSRPEDTRQSFPEGSWARLQAVKAQYDPRTLLQSLSFRTGE